MLSSVTGFIKSQVTTPWRLLDLPVITEASVTSVEKSDDLVAIHLMIGGRASQILLETGNHSIWFRYGSWDDLTRESNFGTSEWKSLLLAAPGIMTAAPVLIANSIFWRVNGKVFGMNRHALSIWCRVRHQLDKETQDLLFEALIRL